MFEAYLTNYKQEEFFHVYVKDVTFEEASFLYKMELVKLPIKSVFTENIKNDKRNKQAPAITPCSNIN